MFLLAQNLCTCLVTHFFALHLEYYLTFLNCLTGMTDEKININLKENMFLFDILAVMGT